ncbi:predicted protein [Naegleria gruberi]|uniref:Predicted protein n=1 Tax=Naegleria gruberi TaxID=5762 RepID=D2VDS1_NAEGR|nr:uncharacterized protein NAEGRDRAFT_67019 [Naegleria gruberi]EFC44948.1 predicted protein [Naegleria gruberi]|eukprot:XP_002677692.1 predicted protein [Naegleria gruberi strain NEG-M]
MNRRSSSNCFINYLLMNSHHHGTTSTIRRTMMRSLMNNNSGLTTTKTTLINNNNRGGHLNILSSSSVSVNNNNNRREFKTNYWTQSKQENGNIVDHSLVEALITFESSRKSVNDNLSILCNQSDITEERLTSILNQKIIEKLDPSTIFTMMQFYAKKGNAPKVKELYRHIKNPNEESKKQLVKLLALAGSRLKTKTNPESITPKVAKNLMKTMPSNINVAHKRSISELKEVEDALKKKKDSVSYTHSVVIEAFSIRGNMKQAETYFENIQHVNTEVLNSMIDGWIRTLTKSDKSLIEGQSENTSEESFNFVKGRVNYYFDLFDLYKIKRDVRTYAYFLRFKFIEALFVDPKDPDVNSIVDLIESMISKDKISPDNYFVSTFLARLNTIHSKAKVKKLYSTYKKHLLKVKVTNANNLAILTTLANSKCIPEALSLFEHLKKSLPTNEKTTAYEIMISMFLESDDEAAIVLIDDMIQKKVPRSSKTYYSVLNYFSQQGNHKAVSKYFQLLQVEGVSLTPEILKVSLKSLALTRSKKQVMDILKRAETENYLTEESCSSFIGTYGLLEELEEAERVFNLFKDTNMLDIYNEMLCTYVNHSCVGDAITLYLDYPMKGDIFTYETLVGALGISKEYSAILQIHKIMIKLGIRPTFKYYDQLIDILTKEPVTDPEVKSFLQSLPDEMSQFNIGQIEQLIMRLLF